ncbi:MAG: cytochrome c biogenesis protein ResB [Pseudomonadota bacterium]
MSNSTPDTTEHDNLSNTSGIRLGSGRSWLNDAIELISSMRFAISLLVLVALAAVIGTVMKQNEPMPNYVNQFGPFWFDIFDKFGLYAVYSQWWFLLIMAFLVLSTSLCITRNAPKMLKDMRSWRDNVREQSLQNFHHKSAWNSAIPRPQLARQLAERIAAGGYKIKLVDKGNATLIAAKQGAANKFGYIFAHSAIVIICVGGLLDSDMPIRFQQWFNGKVPFAGNGVIAQIPQQHRLGLSNPTFRGNTMISEGSSSDIAIIPQKNGVLIQELPFTISLKKFVIDYYSTGMPKLFASEVVIRDHETNATFAATIKVNEPLLYKGLAVYQSSFEDGGSKLKLTGYPMAGSDNSTFQISGEVGNSSSLQRGSDKDAEYTVEWSGFRPFNVENMRGAEAGQDVRAVKQEPTLNENFAAGLDKRLGSAAKNANNKDLKNVGPSVQYKLRDKTGQAREFLNYMQPVLTDGAYVFLAGMRDSPEEPFRYLRIPADDNDSVDEWMRIRAAILSPQLREQAAERYARRAIPPSRAEQEKMRLQLQESATKSLTIFAGDGTQSGYVAVSKFLANIPAAEQEKAAEIFIEIMQGSMWDLWQIARENAGLKPADSDEKHAKFLQLATNAISDTSFYGAPVYLQLREFEEVKASVLQVTRSPGKKVVYLGCLFLVIGVFSMFYIRERRLWVWLKDADDGSNGSSALMAMSSQRKTLDFENEFIALKTQLTQSA